MSRSVKKASMVGANVLIAVLLPSAAGVRRPAPTVRDRPADTSYSELGITGITPILGLFRCPLLPARKRPGTLADALWQLSPVGIIRCHSLSPHRRWMMSSRPCHSGVGRGLRVVGFFAFSRAWRFIWVGACG